MKIRKILSKKMLYLTTIILIYSCNNNSNLKNDSLLINGISVDKLKTDFNGLSSTSAIMKTQYGNIVFRFYTKAAPNTSAKIMKLIQNKFYDGLVFHKVINNFVIQTGNPSTYFKTGSGQKIKLETNDIQHIKGTIGLAHSVDKEDGDSQFYICLTTLPNLDKKFSIFAQVIEGIELLDKIKLNDKIESINLQINN